MHKHSVVRTLTNRAQQCHTAVDRKSELAQPMDTQSGRFHLHHLAQKYHLVRTTTHADPSWDYRMLQGYQNNLVGFTLQVTNCAQHHNLANTLRLMDKTPKEHQCGTIYNMTCDNDNSHTYSGETKRPLSQRFKEHTNLDKPTGLGDHCRATGHSVSMKNTKILTRESNWHKRKVKEAIYTKQRAPSMSRETHPAET